MTMSDGEAFRVSLVEACAPRPAFSPLRTRRAPAPAEPPDDDRYEQGFVAGMNAAAAEFAAERAGLQELVAAAAALQPEASEELAALIATTVERIVTDIVGQMPVERDWLENRIARAMICLDEADAARTLWLHPEDIALLADVALPLEIAADAALERGALRIDCSQGWVEDGRSLHLDTLRAALGVAAS